MNRNLLYLAGSMMLMGGCMKPHGDAGADMMKKPGVPAEMKQLETLVGNWNWTAEMVEPSAEEMAKHMPPGTPAPPSTFTGTGKFEMILGGSVFKGSGSFDMGNGQKMTYEEYWSWDARAKKFRTYFINDWSETYTGWATTCDGCVGFCMKGEGVDAHGNKKRGEGCMKQIDKDTWEWSMTERGPMGKMRMKGTSKRAKQEAAAVNQTRGARAITVLAPL